MKIDTHQMESLLDELWMETISSLITKIRGGEAAPTDIGNAIKMLRDNGIVMDAKEGKQSLEALVESLQGAENSLVNQDARTGKVSIEVLDPLSEDRRQ